MIERELLKHELHALLPDGVKVITEPTDMQWIIDQNGALLAVISDVRVLRDPPVREALARALTATHVYFTEHIDEIQEDQP